VVHRSVRVFLVDGVCLQTGLVKPLSSSALDLVYYVQVVSVYVTAEFELFDAHLLDVGNS